MVPDDDPAMIDHWVEPVNLFEFGVAQRTVVGIIKHVERADWIFHIRDHARLSHGILEFPTEGAHTVNLGKYNAGVSEPVTKVLEVNDLCHRHLHPSLPLALNPLIRLPDQDSAAALHAFVLPARSTYLADPEEDRRVVVVHIAVAVAH